MLASLYIATGLSVFDYITYSFAKALGSGTGDITGYRYHIVLFIFYLALAGSAVFGLAAALMIRSDRWAIRCGALGGLLQLPWVIVEIPSLIVPHLPFVYEVVHIEPRELRASWLVIVATVLSVLALYRRLLSFEAKPKSITG